MIRQTGKILAWTSFPGLAALPQLTVQAAAPQAPTVGRLGNGACIVSGMGSNIQGSSLIRVPDWIENPLGKCYMYFAEHRGSYIRLTYAEQIIGSWKMYEPGSLRLEDSFFPTSCPPCSPNPVSSAALYAYIASPEVHIDNDNQQIIMYIHGRDVGRQLTRLALSADGVNFEGKPEICGGRTRHCNSAATFRPGREGDFR